MAGLAILALAGGPAWARGGLEDDGLPPLLSEAAPVVTQLAAWAAKSGDNNGLPFMIIDKASAQVAVFDSEGWLLSATPALIGAAPGDESVEGIGDRELSDIALEERTTPAGRFRARFGPAEGQGETFWIDFGAAISLHPVVTAKPSERRVERLRSPTPEDNRITFGCINVSRDFYQNVVQTTFKADGGVVYILPDTKRLEEVFPSFQTRLAMNP
jgi:hypothetical protein